MTTISSLPAATPATPVATPSSSNTALPASLAAAFSLDAGVVATFSSPDATAADSTSALYTNLANLAVASNASTSSSTIDLNAEWSSVLKTDPSLAPLAAQMAANQALLKAIL